MKNFLSVLFSRENKVKLKKFFIRTVLAVSILNFMNVNLTFAQVPSKQALVQTKEAKIKTDKMDNTGNIDKDTDKKEKIGRAHV